MNPVDRRLVDTCSVHTPAQPVATHHLPPAVRRLWRIGLVIEAVVLLAVIGGAGYLLDSRLVVAIGTTIVVAYVGARFATIHLRYENWRWGLDEQWLEARQGVLVRSVQIVPRSRVQTVTTRTGPIDRRFGLSSIVVHTAGTHTPNLTIPHLEVETVARLREELGG